MHRGWLGAFFKGHRVMNPWFQINHPFNNLRVSLYDFSTPQLLNYFSLTLMLSLLVLS